MSERRPWIMLENWPDEQKWELVVVVAAAAYLWVDVSIARNCFCMCMCFERSRGVYDSALYKCTFTYLLTYCLCRQERRRIVCMRSSVGSCCRSVHCRRMSDTSWRKTLISWEAEVASSTSILVSVRYMSYTEHFTVDDMNCELARGLGKFWSLEKESCDLLYQTPWWGQLK